ncbi:hypothetical protein Tsubulata_035244 [Turnera subulata]|uniref:F-box domain-containing protein n=1 Tax=Turnera subulata TaxID=218843 RepID=A0A9Q0F6H0_9ROSI|nr:hypothetical protein Tsubulata_035244 [Turnera subulata]
MANLTLLPSVIVEEILALLPSKIIHRFRQVSKSWSSFLVSLEFQKLRTKSTPPDPNFQKILQCVAVDGGYVIESLGYLCDGKNRARLSFPTVKYVRLLGSCNGLVCLAVRHNQSAVDQIVVWNPFTGIYRKLQDICIKNRKRKLQDIDDRRICAYGFGYDSAADDYKVFIATKPAPEGVKVEVFSLRIGFWKEVETADPGKDVEHIPEGHEVGLFVKGALHWHVLIGGKTKIIAFDLAKEKFYDVPVLEVRSDHKFRYKGLGVVGEYICRYLVSKADKKRFYVLLMEEYCNRGSWVPFLVYSSLGIGNLYSYRDFIPQAAPKDGGCMVLGFSEELQHILEIKMVDNEEMIQLSEYQMAMPYIEALTSSSLSFS